MSVNPLDGGLCTDYRTFLRVLPKELRTKIGDISLCGEYIDLLNSYESENSNENRNQFQLESCEESKTVRTTVSLRTNQSVRIQ